MILGTTVSLRDVWHLREQPLGMGPEGARGIESRKRGWVETKLPVAVQRKGKGVCSVEVRSTVFAHAVHLDLPAGAEPEDDCLGLLPGKTRPPQVRWPRSLSAGSVPVCGVHSA